MHLERIDYQINDYKAMELYPFVYKTKRYFKAVHHNFPNSTFRIITYKKDLVHQEALLQHLESIKSVEDESIGKIVEILESGQLVKAGNIDQTQEIIGVVLQQAKNSNYMIFYDFAMKLAPLPENLVKDFTVKLLELIRVLKEKNLSHWLYPDDLYIQRKTGSIRIDCFGDRKHFKLQQQQYISDLWELGYFIFYCLQSFPPYTKKSKSDPHFTCLAKGNHEKFWVKIRKNEEQKIFMDFVDHLFSNKQILIPDLHELPWLKEHQAMGLQAKINEIKLAQQKKKESDIVKEQEKRKRTEKIRKAVAERNLHNTNRGQLHDAFLETFLDHLDKLQSNENQYSNMSTHSPEDTFLSYENENPNVVTAFILATLKSISNQSMEIWEVKNKGGVISMRMKGEIGGQMQVNSRVQIELLREETMRLKLGKVQGCMLEGVWVRNYLCQMLSLK